MQRTQLTATQTAPVLTRKPKLVNRNVITAMDLQEDARRPVGDGGLAHHSTCMAVRYGCNPPSAGDVPGKQRLWSEAVFNKFQQMDISSLESVA